MIPVPNPIPEPAGFDENCRQKGLTWLASNPNCDRPKDFWSPFRQALANGFSGRCGYSAMWSSSGTVDHFVSVNADKALAFEWSNYRFVEGWINSSKNKCNHQDILDPFVVGSGWFEILLPSLQMVTTDAIPPAYMQQAENTLIRLHLRDDERILRQRRAWYGLYQSGKLTLDGLRDLAPLIAAAVEKSATGTQS